MDFLELRDNLRSFIQVGGFANIDPPVEEARIINEAYRQFASEAEFNWEDTTFTTTSGTAEYDLTTSGDRRDWIRVSDVLYGTNTTKLYLSSEMYERQLNSAWTQAASGTPARYWISRPNTIRLHPKPNTTSDTVYIHGCRNPAELSADTDTPTIPTRYHEAIAMRGAWNHLRRYASGDEYKRAKNYLDESRALVNELKAEIHGNERIILRNNRPVARRIYLGAYGSPHAWR